MTEKEGKTGLTPNCCYIFACFSEDCHTVSRHFKVKMQTNPTLASSFNELNFLMRLGATQHKNVCMYEPG